MLVPPRLPTRGGCAAALLVLLAGCTQPSPQPVAAPTSPPPASSATAPSSASAPTSSSTPRPSRQPAQPRRIVVLDPGHNGGNAGDPTAINRLVPAGRGVQKPCNTTGTATDAGYQEHAFNFDVARRAAKLLRAAGVTAALTRNTDDGVGPCVNRRAAIGNRARADAVVSIHADGSTSAGARGFHIAYSAPPLNGAQRGPALRLARTLRDDLRSAGFPTSTYLGSAGLDARDDLAGLNLSTRPAALVECGNMRNPAEAAVFADPRGRQRYATAIANGIVAYLAR